MYNVSVSRAHTGMNFEMNSLQDVLERINDYDHSFPDEIIDIQIKKVPSLSEHRQKKDAKKRASLNLKISTATRLFHEGHSISEISKEMHLPVGAVRTLIQSSIVPEPENGDDNG